MPADGTRGRDKELATVFLLAMTASVRPLPAAHEHVVYSLGDEDPLLTLDSAASTLLRRAFPLQCTPEWHGGTVRLACASALAGRERDLSRALCAYILRQVASRIPAATPTSAIEFRSGSMSARLQLHHIGELGERYVLWPVAAGVMEADAAALEHGAVAVVSFHRGWTEGAPR